MGMHDKPKYLTGKGSEAYVQVGEEFFLHNARIDGTVKINGEDRPQAKLLVSRIPDGEKEVVFTSGAGIVGQIQRIDAEDMADMKNGGMHVRLDAIPSQRGNPTHVLTPANLPPAQRSGTDFGDAPADF